MSAFVVSDKHINSLLSYANKSNMYMINLPNGSNLYFDNTDELTQMGQILLNENYRSVNFRYNDNDQPYEFQFEFAPILSPVEIIKACQCYQYQACETDNYKDSSAYRIVDWIMNNAISNLPGYEQAGWDID